MSRKQSPLQKERTRYKPRLPKTLSSRDFKVVFEQREVATDAAREIKKLFPNSFGKPVAWIKPGKGTLNFNPLTVGVVLSGGQAPGGHNVIAGILDALRTANRKSKLVGFLGGPIGVIKGKYKKLTPKLVDGYRNTGGFDMIGSGRDKIEKTDELKGCCETLQKLGVSALVIIGGDDSNTNAAILAEHFLSESIDVHVIGVPKTIDCDMKNEFIETTFGFDSAAKTYAELVGNICRDSMSACKYWHFIRLMGRSASHLTMEVALQTQPNMAIISEEVQARKRSLNDIVKQITECVSRRADAGKNYGVVLIPEGLLEFMPDMKVLIAELNKLLKDEQGRLGSLQETSEKTKYVASKLSPDSAKVYTSLPSDMQEVLLRRDKHGNVTPSQIETEKLLIDLVKAKLKERTSGDGFKGKFSSLNHFFGYEGRSLAPSNFDANYTYALGYAAVQLIRAGLTGYTVAARNLSKPVSKWLMGGVPVTSMLTIEMRNGEPKPVIKKALVDLDGEPFKAFAAARDRWIVDDAYVFPGTIQYFGPPQLTDAITKTLALEHK